MSSFHRPSRARSIVVPHFAAMPHPALARWPAVDDCLLKLACESGVALESLCGARACVSFEKARALDEVRHRWRMMLTDDAFARACVARMREVTDEEIERAIERRVAPRGATPREALKKGGLGTARERDGGAETARSSDDERPPRFSRAEQAILRGEPVRRGDGEGRGAATGGGSARDAGRTANAATLRKIEALERSAQAATARLATAKGALAELVGTNVTFAIAKRDCVIGRSTEDLKVDVDLGSEGNASKISRQQAFLKLRWNGEFALRNVGRRPIWCNNSPLTTGQRCILAPHTLIEVGGMRLLFLPNPTLIRAAAPELLEKIA